VRFQIENFRPRQHTGKTNESRAISRDLLRARACAIICPLPAVTWLENYMPYRDRGRATAGVVALLRALLQTTRTIKSTTDIAAAPARRGRAYINPGQKLEIGIT